MPTIRCALPVLLLLLATPATAGSASFEKDPEVTFLVGVRNGATLEPDSGGETKTVADPSLSLGVAFDLRVRPDARVELFFDRQTLEFPGKPAAGTVPFDITVDYLQVGGVYEPKSTSTRGFVAFDVGLAHFDGNGVKVGTSLALSGSVGGGAKFALGGRVALRIEGRAYGTLSDGAVQVGCGAGCSVRLEAGGWYQIAARAGIVVRLGGGGG